MVTHHVFASVKDNKETDGGYEHGSKHHVGSGGTNKDTIEQESGKTGQRDGKYPIEIGVGCLDDMNFIGEQSEESFAS